MIELIVYSVIAIIVALVLAAWDNGVRWSVGKYLFLGAFWIATLPIMGFTVLIRKLKS